MTDTQELDIRIQILNSLLTTPHRTLEELAPLHTTALKNDPLFYGHLACWYFEKGEVRDHRALFAAHLATSDFEEFRSAAWVLTQQLAPFEVARVLDHTKRVIGKTPRSLRHAITHYLRTRENNIRQFDGAALRAHKDLKHLYASLRIKPGPRAQAILFDEQPPKDSPLFALKQLARAQSAEEQASIIVENKIPFTTAVGALKQLSPIVLVALLNSMTPQEVINNMAMLQRRGALNDPEVKELVNQKLASAQHDTRVSSMKARQAIKTAKVDQETEERLRQVTDQRIADKVVIKRSTALFVDKSSSMTEAITLATQIAALVSTVIDASFHVYAFDHAAFNVQTPETGQKRPTLSDWEKSFKMIKASGSTSIGAPLAKMTRDKVYTEQIIIVTDGGENTAPYLNKAYQEYQQEMKSSPTIIIVHVGRANQHFATTLSQAGIDVINYTATNDQYSLPNLLPLLALPSKGELVDMIMKYQLPQRPLQQVSR